MVRFKVRYLLAQVVWDDAKIDPSLSASAVQRLLKKEIRERFGDLGSASCTHHLHVKYFNNLTGVLIVRCPRSSYRMIWTTLSLMQFIEQRRMRFTMIHVSGTISSCQKHAIRFHTQAMRQEKGAAARLGQLNAGADDILALDR